jgi:6-phosphofructokinase 2
VAAVLDHHRDDGRTVALPLQNRRPMTRPQGIATLTANPSLDVSTVVPRVFPDRKLRCTEAVREPGGGGINVARAIRKLGGDATACFPAGGPTGEVLASLLEGEGLPRRVVRVRGSTRENFDIVESSTGREYRFCMPGAAMTEQECDALSREFLELAPDVAVLSGSLAPGEPVDFYARAAAALHARGARVVVDTSGDALQRCAGQGVYLIKASIHEFEALVGATGLEEVHVGELASRAVADGLCEVLVVSLGAGGALWATSSERGRLHAPPVMVRGTVGAGDSMVAGIVLALARGGSLADAMRLGVAAGSATVMQPGTALCRLEDVERLLPRVGQTRLEPPVMHTAASM